MVFAVQGVVGFRNAARRDTVQAAIVTRLGGISTWGVTEINATNIRPGNDPAVNVMVRFLTLAEADAFWTDLIATFGSGVNGPVANSLYQQHNCTEDNPAQGPCVVTKEVRP